MSIQELSKYYFIKQEILEINEKIKSLELTIVKATKFSDNKVNNGTTNSNPTEEHVTLLIKLKDVLYKKSLSLVEEQLKIEKYLSEIDDAEVRLIMRKRFIDCRQWDQIADELHYSRPVPYYKVRNYLQSKAGKKL